MKVELKNNNIMVLAVTQTEDETTTSSGIYIPKETLDEDQVAQGVVIESGDPEYKQGELVFFHKVLPIDASMKYRNDKLETFWFIKAKDIICKIK